MNNNAKGKNNPFYGKKHTEESLVKMIAAGKKRNGASNPNYKGGYWKRNIPLYDTYAHRISYAEEVRRLPEDNKILQVICTYCGKWHIPKRTDVSERIKILVNGKTRGEARFYCSKACKKACPLFGMHKNVKGNKAATSREVQPALRKIVLERDNWACIRCGATDAELHCHHIDPVVNNPIESADIDNCITYCKTCHVLVHKNNVSCINKCKEN